MRRFLILLILLGLLGCLDAQAQSPVWAIRGAHNTVYLAGSVHLLKSGEAALPVALEHAYARAKALVMEVDIDSMDSPEAQSILLEKGMYSDGANLKDSIGETRYRRVAAEAERLGIPIEGLQSFEPWAIALTLTQLEYMQLGYDPEQGLETLEQQIDVLAGLSKDDQARFLDQTVSEMHDAERDTQAVLSAWRSGNNAKLAALLGEDYQEFPSLYRALVTDRNRSWMPQIERFLADNRDYLVVVGALHLVGDGGLLELAKARGYKPEPLQ